MVGQQMVGQKRVGEQKVGQQTVGQQTVCIFIRYQLDRIFAELSYFSKYFYSTITQRKR